MKKYFYLPFFLCIIFSSTFSQIIQTGSFRGQFGIDADTRSGHTKYGTAPSPNKIDEDSTSFVNAANGQDPNRWKGGNTLNTSTAILLREKTITG